MNMNTPIWVWLYDYGPHTHPEAWTNGCKVDALPQAHSYAFATEAEARAHPEKMAWSKDHAYVLQRVFLQSDTPISIRDHAAHVVRTYDACSGAEPSVSVLDRAIDELRAALT